MARRKHKLKEMVVIIPLLKGIARHQEVDDLAYEAAQKLSATPVKRFRYVARRPSAISPIADNLEYRAYGTPKE